MNWNAQGEWADVSQWSHYRGIVELPAGSSPDLSDDYANTYEQATLVFPPASFAATLSYCGDVDYFAFDASAGQSYDILVSLPDGQLEDSTVWLYDTDGRTLLQWDDDGGHGLGSRLVWTAPANGTYYFAVDSYALWDSLGQYAVEIAPGSLTGSTAWAWFEHPGQYLDLSGDVGIAFSEPSYTGAPSGWDENELLHLLDLSDPLAPVQVGTYLAGDAEGEGCAFGSDGEHYYLGDYSNAEAHALGLSELVVLDVSASGDPFEVGRTRFVMQEIDALRVEGDYIYAGTRSEDQPEAYLEVYRIANPTAPALVGVSEGVTRPGGGWLDPTWIVLEGDRAYMLYEEPGMITVFDVADPYSPSVLGGYELDPPCSESVWLMDVADAVAWVGVDWELQAVDLSDPSDPQPLGSLPMGGQVGQVVIEGNRAFVGVAGLGVKVVDISDPSDPEVMYSHTVVGATGAVVVNGGYVYVSTASYGTAIFSANIPGDANGDGIVSGADYTLWADHYLQPGDFGDGDFNYSGVVEGADYTIWADHYLDSAAGSRGGAESDGVGVEPTRDGNMAPARAARSAAVGATGLSATEAVSAGARTIGGPCEDILAFLAGPSAPAGGDAADAGARAARAVPPAGRRAVEDSLDLLATSDLSVLAAVI